MNSDWAEKEKAVRRAERTRALWEEWIAEKYTAQVLHGPSLWAATSWEAAAALADLRDGLITLRSRLVIPDPDGVDKEIREAISEWDLLAADTLGATTERGADLIEVDQGTAYLPGKGGGTPPSQGPRDSCFTT